MGQAGTEPYRAATARPARGRPAVRRKAGRLPAGSADHSSSAAAATGSAGTGPHRAATRRPARARHQAQWKAGQAESGRCCPEQPALAQAERAPRERSRAAVPEPSGQAPGDAGQCRRTALPRRWAVPVAYSAGRARPGVRSGLEPAAAARSVRPRAGVVHLAAWTEKSVRARLPLAASDGAAVRARPGWPEARLAARTEDVARSEPRRPGVPAQQAGLLAAGPERGGRRGAPGHPRRGAPARRAAGGADQASRHRRTAPAQAGAMERRNCPATTRWRG